MKMRSVLPMQIAKYGYIAISVIFCIAGAAMLLMDTPSMEAVGIFFGAAMLVFGAIKLVGYFSRDLFRLAFQYDLQFGILLLILGVITLIKPENVTTFVCISLGVFTLTDGLFKAKIARDARRFGIRSWWLTMALSALAGVVGLLLALRPSETIQAIVILLGISLLAEGILNLSVACSLVKIVKHQIPDVIDVEYY